MCKFSRQREERSEFCRMFCAFIPFPKVSYLNYLLGKREQPVPCSPMLRDRVHVGSPPFLQEVIRPVQGVQGSPGPPSMPDVERVSQSPDNKLRPTSPLLQTGNCPRPRGGPWRELYQKREDTSPCHMAFAIFLKLYLIF